ncbi:MAG: hypothetical protein Q8934_14315 [Bacillota bacterium]|nr:hypothetical protein [Bacillota bacterium]
MRVNLNGKYYFDSYDRIHQMVQNNTYDSLSEAIFSKIQTAIHHTEWYNHTPKDFDLFKNFNQVQAYCGDNMACYADSANWTIANKTEFTADLYKFITDRVYVIKHGFADNFLPDRIHWEVLMNLIDWHFIMDCISWFI